MTALSVSAPLGTTRLRLTTRGRRVLLAAAALPAAFALAVAIMSGGAALASRDDNAGASAFTTVTRVDDIVRLNALESPILEPGQSLAIPAEYTSAP